MDELQKYHQQMSSGYYEMSQYQMPPSSIGEEVIRSIILVLFAYGQVYTTLIMVFSVKEKLCLLAFFQLPARVMAR